MNLSEHSTGYRIYIKVLLTVCAILVFPTPIGIREIQLTLTSTSASGTSQLFQAASGPFYFLNPMDVLNFIQSLFQARNHRILMLLYWALHCNLCLLQHSCLSPDPKSLSPLSQFNSRIYSLIYLIPVIK